jgi:type IV pilus assembly protein PilE
MRRLGGFTLVELMIVVVIVAILALVAIPMYSTNVTAARMSEAVAGVGTIRSAARTYLATHGGVFGATAPSMTDLGFATTDLDGKFAAQADYKFTPTASSANYKITFTPSAKMPGGKTYEVDQAGVETTGATYWTTGN